MAMSAAAAIHRIHDIVLRRGFNAVPSDCIEATICTKLLSRG
jgi:hypothetical protein